MLSHPIGRNAPAAQDVRNATAGHAVADTLFRWSLEDECGEELDGFIYLIVCRDVPAFKIGFTTKHPIKRLKQLQTGCPTRLTLRGWYPGSYKQEQALHEKLAPFRLEGEWFRLAPEMDVLLSETAKYIAINNALTGWEDQFE